MVKRTQTIHRLLPIRANYFLELLYYMTLSCTRYLADVVIFVKTVFLLVDINFSSSNMSQNISFHCSLDGLESYP